MVQITNDSTHMSTDMRAHPYKRVKTHTRKHISRFSGWTNRRVSLPIPQNSHCENNWQNAVYWSKTHCTFKCPLRIFLWQTNQLLLEKLKLVWWLYKLITEPQGLSMLNSFDTGSSENFERILTFNWLPFENSLLFFLKQWLKWLSRCSLDM